MNCIICTEPILPDAATLTYPCKCPPVHTLCTLKDAESRPANFVDCPHCEIIYMKRVNPHEITYVATDALKADLKNLKKKRAAANRRKAVFIRKLNEIYRQFRERILISLEFIETEKVRALTELKETEEYRQARKAVTEVYRYESRLKTKHNLGFREYLEFLGVIAPFPRHGRLNSFERVAKTPIYMAERKFQVWI